MVLDVPNATDRVRDGGAHVLQEVGFRKVQSASNRTLRNTMLLSFAVR